MIAARPRRSALYMPGGNARAVEKALSLPADVVILDLEDSVAPDAKDQARVLAAEAARAGGFGPREVVIRVNGRVADILLPDDATNGRASVGQEDPAFAALLTGYRDALASGAAKLERRGTVDGHDVYWLRFPSFLPRLPGTEVAIDRTTYKPVLFREHFSRTGHVDARVLVAETTDFKASDFVRRGPGPSETGKRS